jgi:hypothetical protein
MPAELVTSVFPAEIRTWSGIDLTRSARSHTRSASGKPLSKRAGQSARLGGLAPAAAQMTSIAIESRNCHQKPHTRTPLP